jgi:SAM-dependent methyltransferase
MCPACHASEYKTLGEKNGFTILLCRCGTIYATGSATENYDDYYTDANLQVSSFIEKRVGEIVGEFASYRQTNRLLDIGFGSAVLMRVAREQEWDVKGVEVSAPAVSYAQKQGFDVFHGDLSGANYPDNYFDVITASEIIEHCPEPEILLKEVQRILRPGGLFWATTPAASGLSFQLIGLKWSIISPPEHLQLFSKRAVKMMLEKCGFTCEIETRGFNPTEVLGVWRGAEVDRVATGCALNENLTGSSYGRILKSIVNYSLNLTNLGDSLKIKAVKSFAS